MLGNLQPRFYFVLVLFVCLFLLEADTSRGLVCKRFPRGQSCEKKKWGRRNWVHHQISVQANACGIKRVGKNGYKPLRLQFCSKTVLVNLVISPGASAANQRRPTSPSHQRPRCLPGLVTGLEQPVASTDSTCKSSSSS